MGCAGSRTTATDSPWTIFSAPRSPGQTREARASSRRWTSPTRRSKPLAAVQTERIERRVQYARVSEDVKQWEAFVQTNRQKKHLSFVSRTSRRSRS